MPALKTVASMSVLDIAQRSSPGHVASASFWYRHTPLATRGAELVGAQALSVTDTAYYSSKSKGLIDEMLPGSLEVRNLCTLRHGDKT
eukprot:1663610-Rhodomonas_salina.1